MKSVSHTIISARGFILMRDDRRMFENRCTAIATDPFLIKKWDHTYTLSVKNSASSCTNKIRLGERGEIKIFIMGIIYKNLQKVFVRLWGEIFSWLPSTILSCATIFYLLKRICEERFVFNEYWLQYKYHWLEAENWYGIFFSRPILRDIDLKYFRRR